MTDLDPRPRPEAAAPVPSPRALARRRRQRALGRFARSYARNRAGMFGLLSLLVIATAALTAPMFVEQSHLLSLIHI